MIDSKKSQLALAGLVGLSFIVVLTAFGQASAQDGNGDLTGERLVNARKEPQNWATYFGAYDAWRYSSLDQIRAEQQRSKTTVIMVTNDIDEAILLADRVYPLTRGPAATLGHPITSALLRPRSRHGISLDPAYQEARQHIMTFLEQSKKASAIIRTATPAPGLRIASSSSQTASSPPFTSRMQSL